MRRVAIAIVILAASVTGIVEAAGPNATPVRSKVAITTISTDVAGGKVTAKGKGVPPRVKRLCQRKTERKFRCKGGTSASVTPSPTSP